MICPRVIVDAARTALDLGSWSDGHDRVPAIATAPSSITLALASTVTTVPPVTSNVTFTDRRSGPIVSQPTRASSVTTMRPIRKPRMGQDSIRTGIRPRFGHV